jgi:cytidyltransferase-like protein
VAKKVFVTGCFDMLHSGHVAFLQEAAQYGSLYVGLGSDTTVYVLKGRYPVNNQDERQYMIKALSCVKDCIVNSGSGIMDFLKEIEDVNPDIFIVNEDGYTPAKEKLCKEKNIEFIILSRMPHGNLPARSTTTLRKECNIPYRIDLAGGWLDQPYVSKFAPGPVLTISIEPTIEFNDRSGMATSTRKRAVELWHTDIPHGDKEQIAKVLFSYENTPGQKEISGSQDSIGIVYPNLNKLNYTGGYWPASIETVEDETIISWLENNLYLITLGPRGSSYGVLTDTYINEENVKALSAAAENCWHSILKTDLKNFGRYFKDSFEAQIKMFPNMMSDSIYKIIEKYKDTACGWKLSGAGGGGYLILVSGKKIDGAIKIKIRRKMP